jgi:hypothetical protein
MFRFLAYFLKFLVNDFPFILFSTYYAIHTFKMYFFISIIFIVHILFGFFLIFYISMIRQKFPQFIL